MARMGPTMAPRGPAGFPGPPAPARGSPGAAIRVGAGGDDVDFAWPDELAALAAEADAVGRAAADRAAYPEDGWLVGYDPDLAVELAERGWLGMTWPVEAGGGGRTPLERFAVFEALLGAGAPMAACWFADRQIGPTLLQYGTAEQRARWLPGILSGRDTWCIGMSEPDAGSDVASLRTTAVATDDGVRGQRPQGVDQRRGAGRLVLPDRPHRPRRTPPRRAVGPRRRHARAGHRGAADHRHDRQRPLLRGHLRRGAGPRATTSSASRTGPSSR